MQNKRKAIYPMQARDIFSLRLSFLILCFLMCLNSVSLIAQEKVKMMFNGSDVYTFDSTRIDVEQVGGNLFIGDQAGFNNNASDTTGFSNVFLGTWSGLYNNKGAANSFVGALAGFRNVSGHNNTYLGSGAGAGDTDGLVNVANNNTFIGAIAGFSIVNGNDNASIGISSLHNLTSGTNNVALGSGALAGITTTSGNVAIGYQAGAQETGANKLYIANSNTTTPLLYGEFDNQLLRINGQLQIGTEYILPSFDGSMGQVMATDGSGQMYWEHLDDNDPWNELIDSVKFNYPFLEFYQGGHIIPIATDLFALHEDSDADPTNELQMLSVSGDSLYLSDGNSVKIPGGTGTSIVDDDGDTRVEAINFLFGNDKIDLTVDNNNYLRLVSNRIGFRNTNNNIVISDTTGQSLGNHNTFVGSGTGNALTIGDGNTFLGSGAGANIFTGSNNIFIGKDAGSGINSNDRLYIENSNSSSPLIYGEFDTDRVGINGRLAVGHQAPSAQLHVKSQSTEAARFESIDNTTVNFHKAGANKGFIQAFFDDFIFGKTNGPDGSVQLYNQGHYLSLENDGDVAIGTSATSGNRLYVESDKSTHALASVVTYSGPTDVQAIRGISQPADGYGIGGYFAGGYYGVQGHATGGTSFQRYGLYGNASGGTSTYGVYGTAAGGSGANWAGFFASGDVFVTNDLRIGNQTDTDHELSVGGSAYVADELRIGSVTGASTYRLAVDGKIMAEELKIQDSSNWPDYVFADDYQLMPLEELERQIEQNKHLPGIPSAAEVAESGLLVGDMQKRMMEKIEELTLHIIALQKRIAELENDRK